MRSPSAASRLPRSTAARNGCSPTAASVLAARASRFAFAPFGAANPGAPHSHVVQAARIARDRALAAFSEFKVGAALETTDGRIITGCNIENSTYGLTMCAERVAIFKAVSEGYRSFTRIVVVADTSQPTSPCGACRQMLWEFAGDIEVILADLDKIKTTHRLKDLLPHPFDARFIE